GTSDDDSDFTLPGFAAQTVQELSQRTQGLLSQEFWGDVRCDEHRIIKNQLAFPGVISPYAPSRREGGRAAEQSTKNPQRLFAPFVLGYWFAVSIDTWHEERNRERSRRWAGAQLLTKTRRYG